MLANKRGPRPVPGASAKRRLRAYFAWDAPTRRFHWINAILIILMVVLGVAMLTGRWFGVGVEGRDRLNDIHLALGAVLTVNLLWRCYWAFRGNRPAQWRSVLPGGPGYWRSLRAYVTAFVAGQPKYYIGHNPLARLGVTVLLVLLVIQIVSGFALLGVDALAPPPGPSLGDWGSPSAGRELVPPLPWLVAWSAADAQAVRAPLRAIHLYCFYLLVIAVVGHVVAVVVTEFWEGGNLVSAMLTGWKAFPNRPEDEDAPDRSHRGKHR